MSGPKVDTAELRRQQRERLEAERRKRQVLASDIQETIRDVQRRCNAVCELLEKTGNFSDSSENMRKQQTKYEKTLNSLLKAVKNGNELYDTVSARNELNSIRRELNMDPEIAHSMALIEKNEELMRIKREAEVIANAKRRILETIAEAPDTPDEGITEEQVRSQADAFEEAIREQMESGELLKTHRNSILLISQDLHGLLESPLSAEIRSKRLRRLYTQYQQMGAVIRKDMELMRAAYKEYCDECFDNDSPAASLTDFSSVKEVREAAEKVRERAENRLSQEYIKRQIDDVMAKHGYNMIHSELLKEADASGQALYGVDENSAINVFVSDDNQVTMRVVGIGFDSDISDAESEKLYQQQCAFCSLHPQITAELEMRGVILKTRKHNPPDKKFNKKIQTRSRKDEKSVSRSRKDLKRQELRTMHKES